jgi:hypothetical protein
VADAPINQLSYLGIDKPTLGYRTNTSPVDESPHWVFGSANTMSTITGEMEKRPGFADAVETALTKIPGTVRRLFCWRRFSGSFFVMASVETTIPGSLSQVWKYEVGVDQSFSIIYADTTSTTSQPFDFITSNNFVFFGNATTRQNMRKFDGIAISSGYRASLWGLDPPVAAPSRAMVTPTLPPGLTFNGTSLTGIPSIDGDYSVTFTATDAYGDTVSQSFSFYISKATLDWQSSSGPITFGEKGVPYTSLELQAWGGTSPYIYTVVSGALPPGLTLDVVTGELSGTPTTVGDFTFAVKVTDSVSATLTRVFSLFVGNPSIVITPPAPITGEVGVAYSGAIVATGGVAPYAFGIAGGSPPPGMAMDALGNITGTPSSSGIYQVTFLVTDSYGVSNQLLVKYTITTIALSISSYPAPLPAKVGYAYSFTPFASGGTETVTSTSPFPSGQTHNSNWINDGNEWYTNFPFQHLGDIVFQKCGLSIPPSVVIVGVEISSSIKEDTLDGSYIDQIALYDNNAQVGTIKSPHTLFTTDYTTQTWGGSTDMWGLTSNDLIAMLSDSSFGWSLVVNNYNPLASKRIHPPYTIKVYYNNSSIVHSMTASPDAITVQTGCIYGQTFTSIYGHESSMSALSESTGVFTGLAVQTNVLSSADLQVNGINLYRTTDGGDADPAAMRLVASLPNVDARYTDTTPDIYLGSQTGPALYVNDPPQPLNGFVWSNGRIWGKNGARTWFTGNEEITNGIPAECMSDAINGNYYAWPSQVGGMAVTSNGVDIGLGEQFWQVSGDSLATFRKSKLLQGGGIRYPINILSVGDNVYWIDTSKQGWSSSDGEFGENIRPDLAVLDLSSAFIGFHKSKLFNWIYILDAVRSILYVYNLDLNQWNTPWQFGARMTAITSGELTEGNVELIAAFDNGHVMYLNPDAFDDDGTLYSDTVKSNLLAVVPGRGTTARNAVEVRKISQFDMEVNKIPIAGNDFEALVPQFFGCLVDDDPGQTAQDGYFDLSSNIRDPQYQDQTVQKKYIAAKCWGVDQDIPPARRIAFMAQWGESANGWVMFGFDVAWRT